MGCVQPEACERRRQYLWSWQKWRISTENPTGVKWYGSITVLSHPLSGSLPGVLGKRVLKNGWAALFWTKFLFYAAVRTTMRMTVMKRKTSRAWPQTASTGHGKTRSPGARSVCLFTDKTRTYRSCLVVNNTAPAINPHDVRVFSLCL